MKTTEHTFTVRGRVPFPIDMLRYDACWPVTAADAQAIEDSINRVSRTGYDVTLTTNSKYGPTKARWNSFMWNVLPRHPQ